MGYVTDPGTALTRLLGQVRLTVHIHSKGQGAAICLLLCLGWAGRICHTAQVPIHEHISISVVAVHSAQEKRLGQCRQFE